MTGGSEKALIERGYSPRNDLDLRTREIFMMLIVGNHNVAHGQVLNFF
jgi:hypothetical protein